MSNEPLHNVVDYCRRLTGAPVAGHATDGQLLHSFAARNDQAAFELLLGRHGPLVLGVCRRVLGNAHDAEDAFQATFQVLAFKAGSLDGQKSVAGWLYTVAYHIARKARVSAARRRLREQRVTGTPPIDPAEEAARRDLRLVLDEELGRLPEKYRDPLVYCYLEGKTNEEAAQLLGWSKGTVSGRLARARELLRRRLSRRGATLAPAAVGGLPATPELAPVPAALVQATALAVLPGGAGQAASAPVAALVQGALRRLLLARLRLPALVLLVVCLLGAAAVVVPPLLGDPAPEHNPVQPAAVQPGFGPAIVVQAVYPGANSRVVADTVAVPIEQQLRGVEGLTHLASQCDNAGNYTLTVTFTAGTDPEQALVRVQNRVALLQPVLPEAVWKGRVTVRQKAGDVLLFVVLTSDGRQDALALSEVTNKRVRDELSRLPGVGDVQVFGEPDQAVRVWLNPDRMRAYKISSEDVMKALSEQSVIGSPGRLGQATGVKSQSLENVLTLIRKGRPQTAAELENIPVRTNPEGELIRLKDVGRIETGPTAAAGLPRYNGKAAVVLGVAPLASARPTEVGAEVRSRLAQLRKKLPEGVRLEVIFDASSSDSEPGYLRLDVRLPEGATLEYTQTVLGKCVQRLAGVKGVRDVLELCGPPVASRTNQGCVLVGLGPALGGRAGVAAIRNLFGREFSEAQVRVGDPARPGQLSQEGYAVVLGVHGPDERQVRDLAQKLANRLNKSEQLTDVGWGPGDTENPVFRLDIDEEKVKRHGLSINKVLDALQITIGSSEEQGFVRIGHIYQVYAAGRRLPKDLDNLFVRNDKKEWVPLSAVASIREHTCPVVVQRFNGAPMATVTANLAPGVSPAAARALCEALAAEVLPTGYRLNWLHDLPTAE